MSKKSCDIFEFSRTTKKFLFKHDKEKSLMKSYTKKHAVKIRVHLQKGVKESSLFLQFVAKTEEQL